MIISNTSMRVSKYITLNLSKILGRKIFKYKDIFPIIEVSYPSTTCIRFFKIYDMIIMPICSISVYINGYNLIKYDNEFPGKLLPIRYIKCKGFIIDRWRIYRWLNKIIKEYNKNDKS